MLTYASTDNPEKTYAIARLQHELALLKDARGVAGVAGVAGTTTVMPPPENWGISAVANSISASRTSSSNALYNSTNSRVSASARVQVCTQFTCLRYSVYLLALLSLLACSTQFTCLRPLACRCVLRLLACSVYLLAVLVRQYVRVAWYGKCLVIPRTNPCVSASARVLVLRLLAFLVRKYQ